MWKLLFLLVATVVAVHSQSYDDEMKAPNCRWLIYEKCQKYGGFRLLDNVPGSEEELEKECKLAVEFFECGNRIKPTCLQSEFDRKYERELELNIRRICDKDNLLHDALVESLPCIKENLDKISLCPVLQGETIDTFIEGLANIGISEVAAPNTEPIKCLHYLNTLGCTVANIDTVCGEVAKDAVVDVTQGINTYFRYCLPGIKEKLGDIATMMKEMAENEETDED